MHLPPPPWTLLAHPMLLGQLTRLEAAVEAAMAGVAHSQTVTNAQLLTALRVMLTEIIPSDPLRAEYRAGGAERLGWRLASFAAGRFGILFRVDAQTRSILFGWVWDRAARPAHAGCEPAVLFGKYCLLTRHGRLSLPDAARKGANFMAGEQLALRLNGPALLIEGGDIHDSDAALANAATCLARPAPTGSNRSEPGRDTALQAALSCTSSQATLPRAPRAALPSQGHSATPGL